MAFPLQVTGPLQVTSKLLVYLNQWVHVASGGRVSIRGSTIFSSVLE